MPAQSVDMTGTLYSIETIYITATPNSAGALNSDGI